MTDLIKTDIYDYSDYRIYLKDVYRINKQALSVAGFSRFDSNGGSFSDEEYIRDIFNGRIPSLSISHCIQISYALGHSETEAEYFRCLVALSQAHHENEVRYLNNMRKAIADRNNGQAEMVDKSKKEFYSEWYHSAVRALVDIFSPAPNDYGPLGRSLSLPVTDTQIKRSVELLERLGFIKMDVNGNFQIATGKNIKTGTGFSQQEKKRINMQFLNLAEQLLQQGEPEEQKVSSHILGISRKTYEKIRSATDAFKTEINRFVEEEEKPDRVYLYQLVFIPLTKNGTPE